MSESLLARRLQVLVLFLVALACALPGTVESQSPATGLDSIRADEIRSKLSYLASDEFRGRGNGTTELDEAARYIAGVFEENGLVPAGGAGYFQEFTVERLSLGEGNTLVTSERPLRVGRDFVPYSGSADGKVRAPLVFAGYGVQAPEIGYDDLESADVSGRIVVALDGHPRSGRSDTPFHELSPIDRTSIRAKALNVERGGGVGLIIALGPRSRNALSVSYMADRLKPGLSPRRGIMELTGGSDDPNIPIVIVSSNVAQRIVPGLRSMQQSIEQSLESRFMRLSGEATLAVDLRRETYTARNVIGLIEGSDPDRRDKILVAAAHYDHDGAEVGRIWNGADDDGSGTTALLELAEAFGMGSVRPARSVLLAAWAAEEKGLLGSRYYVSDPPVPLADTLAVFQMDMIGRNEDHGADSDNGEVRERASENENSLNVIGSVFSPDLALRVDRANAAVGLELRFRYDYRDDGLIKRSDSWSFLSSRVPALFLFAGFHPDYHRTSDTADKINYPKLEKVVKLVYLAITDLGNARGRPRFTDPSSQQ